MPVPISVILNRDPNDILLFEDKINEFITEKKVLIFEKLKTPFAIFDRFIDFYELKKRSNKENMQLAKAKHFAIKFTTFGDKLILLCFTKIDSKALVNICCYCEQDNIENIGNLKKSLLNIFVS